ncbi:MAG TPA: ATP-binding protein [Thermoanaerobaculia bacterium]|nr:ATP-binding protein [Thermoanaerobaculia bacterium]
MRDLPIRRKLALVILSTCAAALLVAAIAAATLDLIDARAALVRDTTVLADVIARNTQASLAFRDPEAAATTLRALESDPNVEEAAIRDAGGMRFAEYVRPGRAQRPGELFSVSRPITMKGRAIGSIEVQSSTRRLVARLRHLVFLGAVVLAGALLVAILISRRMQNLIIGPLLDLTETSRFITRAGNFTVRARSVANDEIGELTGAFNQMLDVLEQRDRSLVELNDGLESHVRERTLQLEHANQELESFSYSVSHDLRAPLRAVDGYARLLEEDYANVLDADGRRLLSVVRDEARRMGVLIDDLLDFSRLSRQPLRPSMVDLAAMAESIVAELRRARPDRRIELTCETLPRALADAGAVRQVLVNLLSNAVKYAKPEGVVHITMTGHRDGEMNAYQVRDQGVGFDMKYVGKIFGVFQRLHGEEFEGTGVGLAIVERIVARHGGVVRAEGVSGEGACFHFTLPAAERIEVGTQHDLQGVSA